MIESLNAVNSLNETRLIYLFFTRSGGYGLIIDHTTYSELLLLLLLLVVVVVVLLTRTEDRFENILAQLKLEL